jgi:N4-gp56 family major capsid protein
MAQTVIGTGDAKAVQKFSAFLAVDVGKKSYFNKKFMGVGVEAETPLQTLPELETDAGEKISYDLVMALKMKPIQGDNTLRGKEEDLKFYTDSVLIDQLRGGVNTGGRMTRKRTIHDLRKIARARQSDWWARLFDETIFMYLAGARGVATDFIEDTSFTGYAGNAFVAPDTNHLMYGGAATSKATLASTDKMSLSVIDKAVTKASTMGGGTTGIPRIQPCMIDGEETYVLLMHDFQLYDLRTNTSTGQWLDIQKAAATANGTNNPIFKGGAGVYNNTVLHVHRNTIRYSDYGAGGNVAAARALFLGRQAGVVAFGSPGTGLRFDWNEEMEDRGNQVVITTASIFGVKKTAYTIDGTSRDFGVVSIDTAAADPNP